MKLIIISGRTQFYHGLWRKAQRASVAGGGTSRFRPLPTSHPRSPDRANSANLSLPPSLDPLGFSLRRGRLGPDRHFPPHHTLSAHPTHSLPVRLRAPPHSGRYKTVKALFETMLAIARHCSSSSRLGRTPRPSGMSRPDTALDSSPHPSFLLPFRF